MVYISKVICLYKRCPSRQQQLLTDVHHDNNINTTTILIINYKIFIQCVKFLVCMYLIILFFHHRYNPYPSHLFMWSINKIVTGE